MVALGVTVVSAHALNCRCNSSKAAFFFFICYVEICYDLHSSSLNKLGLRGPIPSRDVMCLYDVM